jgi:hypothetical protein
LGVDEKSAVDDDDGAFVVVVVVVVCTNEGFSYMVGRGMMKDVTKMTSFKTINKSKTNKTGNETIMLVLLFLVFQWNKPWYCCCCD